MKLIKMLSCLCTAIIIASLHSANGQEFTLNITSKKMQEFTGLGFTIHKAKTYFLPSDESVENKLYSETFAGMNNVVFWSYIENPEERDLFIQKGEAHGLKSVIVNTTGYPQTAAQHAQNLFLEIKEYIDAGYPVYGTTIMNKPNTDESGTSRQEPVFVSDAAKMLRHKLDSAGFTNVKIGGPSTVEWHPYIDPTLNGAAHGYDFEDGDNLLYLQAFLDDQEALDAIDAFDFQSYGWSVSSEMQQIADSLNKELWVTLAATDGKNNNNGDPVLCPISAANCLANLNHGVSTWNHWVWDQLVNFNTGQPNTRMQYLQQIGRNINVGARFRKTTVDQENTPADMQWNFFNLNNPSENIQPEIVAAAAQNPDNSWTIALVNLTGVHAQHFASEYVSSEAKTLSGKINIEELVNMSGVEFQVSRIDMGGLFTDFEKVNLNNGTIDFELASGSLAVLKSSPVMSALQSFSLNESLKIYPNPTSGFLNIKGLNNKLAVSIYDLTGKIVMQKTVVNEKLDISELKSGIYLLKAQVESDVIVRKIIKK